MALGDMAFWGDGGGVEVTVELDDSDGLFHL